MRQQFNVRIEWALIDRMRRYARSQSVTVEAAAAAALEDYLDLRCDRFGKALPGMVPLSRARVSRRRGRPSAGAGPWSAEVGRRLASMFPHRGRASGDDCPSAASRTAPS